eukprot:Amastigsp_a841639_12.p3 type:complete len:192 gc:universal Amastigsp_a841639_12:412-987(+)
MAYSATKAAVRMPSLSNATLPTMNPMASSYAKIGVRPAAISLMAQLPIHLKPVRVVWNRAPTDAAKAPSICDETAVVIKVHRSAGTSGCDLRNWVQARAPKITPSSLPLKMVHEPSACFSATARRSASGSVARMSRECAASAVSMASLSAPLPSSGLGNTTVGKSGSGSTCSTVGTGWVSPKQSKARWTKR